MKKLIKKPALLKSVQAPPVEKKPRKKGGNKLPSDQYKDEFEPMELVISNAQKIICSVQRGGVDGLPMADIRIYHTTETYTGYSKKGIRIPIEYLGDLVDLLTEVQDKCEECGLFEEVE